MPIEVDLDRYHWKRTVGGITLIGTWLVDHQHNRPCMVLLPAGGERHPATVPCIIPIDTAYIFRLDKVIGDPQAAALAHIQFAKQLRLNEHDPKTLMRLGKLIDDHLGDLLSIPPYIAQKDGEVIGELTVTDRASGSTREIEIKNV